jgi:hypothetical protein
MPVSPDTLLRLVHRAAASEPMPYPQVAICGYVSIRERLGEAVRMLDSTMGAPLAREKLETIVGTSDGAS